ncbi:FAD/NAD(P)-binding domain-containing protein [Trichoderma citrinoviride]|uniref:FAD/NAD(P)-binding domain-containing protein n=1 Tax=Trichoderma citrinoviride TaxID=58853 RepID=A0A2T4BEM9_9HYPO|nr:FAD/NAD(P)-binding domain-containing protein [Trichoderma citrinoviride]PTB67792.1 FAD/NAD(P)-binding domain-containing protein [Trichoderma citrinoviride]
MQNMRIAIIGAGPAGCMLARLLHLGGIQATVFEGETSASIRSQGGSLDLHTESGLAAIKEAGLWDVFLSHARYDGQYLAVVDKDLHYYIVRNADAASNIAFGERPEIDRVKLREILLDSLPEDTVKWGHRLQRVDGTTLTFTNGTTADFDLVVGADGAFSKVRLSIAPELKPEFTGVGMHDLSIPDAEKTAPEIYKLVNRGSLFASADHQRFTLQQMGDGSISMGFSFVREDPDWMKPDKCGYDCEDLAQVKKALAKEMEHWGPVFHKALDAAQGRTLTRSLFRLPVGAKWEHKPGVTLIGDAAHLMTPHAGEGVNQALEDAMILARVILKAQSAEELDDGIRQFESDMMARVEKIQQLAWDRCQGLLFTTNVTEYIVGKWMQQRKIRMAEQLDEGQVKAMDEAMAKAQAEANARNKA